MKLLSKIINIIKNFFKMLITYLITFIHKILRIEDNDTETGTSTNKTPHNNIDNIDNTNDSTSLPETPNNLGYHPTNENITTTDIYLSINKPITSDYKEKNNDQISLYTDEEIELIIEEEIKEFYHIENQIIKNTSPIIEEKIKKTKKKIIPIIKNKIKSNKITNTEELKTQTKKEINKELIPTSYIQETNSKEPKADLFFIAYPSTRKLKVKEKEVYEVKKRTTIKIDSPPQKVKEKIDETPIKMVQNTTNIPKHNIKDNIKEIGTSIVLTTVGIASYLTSPTKEEPQKKSDVLQATIESTKVPESFEPNKQEIEKLLTKKDEVKTIEELNEIQSSVERKIEEIELNQKNEQKKNEKKDSKSQTSTFNPPAKDQIKEDFTASHEIITIENTTNIILNDSQTEIEKEEFEEKDYDSLERQIDKCLNDITNTYLRYETHLSPTQKNRLEKEETKLRNTKEKINKQKIIDIEKEKKLLEEKITEEEIKGFQLELKKINEENNNIANEKFFNKIKNLENTSQNQVTEIDKQIIFKKLKKASFLLEMGSIISLPFIRNKYFFYFTIGTIISNHFNFINFFLNRRPYKYQSIDLSAIQKGKDALNGALDITYKNIIELNYIEEETLTKYPELAYDPKFIEQVTNLRINLVNKYNKLMKKNKILEKYYYKSKKQLKKIKPAA